MNLIINNVSQLLMAMAVICTLVSVVTEFTKEIGCLARIPTALQVLVLSVFICLISFLAYTSYLGMDFDWYHLVAIIFLAFIVAIICCRGWEYLIGIWKRFYRLEER